MKILIVGFSKIKFMPYLNFYLSNLDCEKHDVHVLFWNRDGSDDVFPPQKVTLHEFSALQKDEVPHRRKILNFLRFRSFAKKLIREQRFDFLIILLPIPAILLYGLLKRSYHGRFFFDYRDLTYENIPLFRNSVAKIIRASKTTFISSDGFRAFLPEEKNIITTHNLQKEPAAIPQLQKSEEPLTISFWGIIRQEGFNDKIIHALANDSRFALHYYGREEATAAHLKRLCTDENIKNVFFHGEYTPDERALFASRTALLHNLYENDTMQYAMSNKYYDGLRFRLPILCMKDSFMGEKAEKAGVGKMFDPADRNFADEIRQYYQELDFDVFKTNCEKELARVTAEYDLAAEQIQNL